MDFKYNSPFQMDCRVWLIVFITLTTVTGMVPKSFEGQIRDRLLNNANYSSRERPVINASDAVQVDMKMYVYAMTDLNEHDQVLTTAVWISLQWKDLRLSWNASKFGDVTVVPVYVEEIWTPSIFIINALDSDSLSIVSPERGMILLDSDGVATMGTPAVLSTQCPLSTVPISLSNINIAYGDKRLTVLKYTFMRRLLIEYLPRVLGVPSYSERINCLNKPNKRTNQLENSDMETRTPESLDDHLDTTEKTKIEARTVALVLDRIASIIFFSVFLLLVIQVIVDFNGNDGPAQILCEENISD